MRRLVAVLLGLAGVFSATARAGDLETLVDCMTGSFSSAEQAAEDESHRDIRLQTAPIWPERDDGHWLYVEQASAAKLDRPYRQRVYRVTELEDGSPRSEVYTSPDALSFAGEWRSAEPLKGLAPESLELREGCAVILRKTPERVFVGATVGKNCTSNLRGARYATSEVTVGPDRIESWDRGFTENGEQVWGAEKGPYVFRRASPD